jgi:hypothetical protein
MKAQKGIGESGITRSLIKSPVRVKGTLRSRLLESLLPPFKSISLRTTTNEQFSLTLSLERKLKPLSRAFSTLKTLTTHKTYFACIK